MVGKARLHEKINIPIHFSLCSLPFFLGFLHSYSAIHFTASTLFSSLCLSLQPATENQWHPLDIYETCVSVRAREVADPSGNILYFLLQRIITERDFC